MNDDLKQLAKEYAAKLRVGQTVTNVNLGLRGEVVKVGRYYVTFIDQYGRKIRLEAYTLHGDN